MKLHDFYSQTSRESVMVVHFSRHSGTRKSKEYTPLMKLHDFYSQTSRESVVVVHFSRHSGTRKSKEYTPL